MVEAVKVSQLRKEFRGQPTGNRISRWFRKTSVSPVCAVEDISFAIQPGEQVAFVGPNGAGKSTTIKMLAGILAPTSGTAEVLGMTPWRQRSELAYSVAAVFGQRSQLWYHLPVMDSWKLLGKIYGVDPVLHRQRLGALMDRFNAAPFANRLVKNLSLGERMRCELIGCFLHGPKVLFLDEPTIGLDVEAKASMRELVREMCAKEGCTLLLTSHDTGDMESVCNQVIMINHGKVLFDDTVAALRRKFVREKVLSITSHDRDVPWDSFGLPVIEQKTHSARLSVDTSKIEIQSAMQKILSSTRIADIAIEDPPMEETIKKIYATAHRGAVV